MLRTAQVKLVGDCLITAAFLSYLGPFTFDVRQELMATVWQPDVAARKLPLSVPFCLFDHLTTEVQTAAWASDGLPSDELSVQNGILTMRASRYPLCIDPQMQAVTWIKRKCGMALDGRVKALTDGDMLKQLELAVQYGFPFLLEGLDEYIDPVLDPVLERNFIGGGSRGRKAIRLGDKEVEWDDNFRLYMTSKLANPHYSPEVAGKTMLINYGVTPDGLQAQLLNVTVRHERPNLEELRERLVAEMATNKATLGQLEDTLLSELSTASGAAAAAPALPLFSRWLYGCLLPCAWHTGLPITIIA